MAVSFLVEAPEQHARTVEHFVHELAQSLVAETQQLTESDEVMEVTGASVFSVETV
jgi:hypothetical protein